MYDSIMMAMWNDLLVLGTCYRVFNTKGTYYQAQNHLYFI